MSCLSGLEKDGDSAQRALYLATRSPAVPWAPWETNAQRRRRIHDLNAEERLRFAVIAPADQTCVYAGVDGLMTTKHPEARLYRTRAEAEAKVRALGAAWDADIEEVRSVREFRSREDTW